jgi:rfaE bifunctional protein nucleotidyltransferase chain/domain
VFDVVHPGHLRHLSYARSKADVLVCAVTADAHVAKGPNRPHVPQDLRAANLAMLDIVDYVVVVDEAKPLDLIARLRPDYYAKGFEYSSEAGHGRQIAEVAVVESYGGQVLFTPGDVVYSSSALIEASAPDLRWDKLAMLMRSRDLSFNDLRRAVKLMRGQTVHVVGDTIVDALLYCDMIGANAKTPTISVKRDRREEFAGGAAVVAKHARAAGAEVFFTTVLAGDQAGKFVVDDLSAAGVEVQPVVDSARPTTIKEAVVVGGYRMIKIDTVDNRPVSGAVLRRLCEWVASTTDAQAVVFSDFRHGIFHGASVGVLSMAAHGGCLRAADSQVASRWGNIRDFLDFDLITPNEREARFSLGDQDSGVRPLAARLAREARCRWLLMKLGPRGVLGFAEPESHAAGEDLSFALDSHAGVVADPVGAGDAFLAYAVLSLLARPGCLATAAILGSFAAGIECGYDGNVPVAPEYVLSKIDEAEREVG